VGFYEYCNEPLGSERGKEFHDYSYSLLKTDFQVRKTGLYTQRRCVIVIFVV
jgi:hypothetical protein